MFRREKAASVMEMPQPLGIEPDPEKVALFSEFMEGHNYDDVYALWKDPQVTNPTIRQCAVNRLTEPSLRDDYTLASAGRLLYISESLSGNSTSSLRERLAGRPDLAHELAESTLYWLDRTGDQLQHYSREYSDYQRLIKELLPLVNATTGQHLFSHFLIIDPQPYSNIDFVSGYNPLKDLLSDPAIPAEYKNAGLNRWFEVAEQEIQGASQPREEHERATWQMSEFIQSWTFGNFVDQDIHGQIVAFLENHTPAGATYVETYSTSRVGREIADEDLRFAFALRHVFAEPEEEYKRFQITDQQDLSFIEWVQQQAEARGLNELDAKAAEMIRAYEEKHSAEYYAALAKEAAELALMERLRAE